VDSTSRDAPLYEAYWAAVGRSRSTEQLRSTAWLILALQVIFSVLDRWAFPDRFPFFLAMRMSVNLAMITILLRLRFTHPKFSEMLLCMSVGGEILAMIYATGGPESRYYPGLVILFVGMPVLMPLRAREALVVVAAFCSGFAVSPLAISRPFSVQEFVVALVFVFSGAVESVLSCTILTQASLRDFAQHRDLERARDDLKELDRAKSRFTANIHHELRTPLTLVLSPLEAMLGGEFGEMGERPRHYLRTMQVNALRLLKLINNLLDVAKAESKELRLRRRATDIGNLLRDVTMGARPMAERKGVRLETHRLEGLATICVDPEALEKIVMNLVGNALKFTDPGGHITMSAQGEESGGIRITVSDTGLGIPREQLDRIFDRFAQVDTSATRKYEGTGIGLSLVRELVTLHGGRVWAESEGLGHGARFHVTLPVGEEDAGVEDEVLQTDSGQNVALDRSLGALEGELNLGEAGIHDGERTQYEQTELAHTVARWEGARSVPIEIGPTLSAPEVIVAEDNGEMRRLLAHLLSHEFHVREARNGREALDAVHERAPDLVLTDVMMPEMSGTDLCRELKSAPETASIPVVLVTSKAEREMKVMGLELGADDYVTKPFHPRELLARVR
jgi:signal transduction histidine kinase/CheY-like chemotaxis protein